MPAERARLLARTDPIRQLSPFPVGGGMAGSTAIAFVLAAAAATTPAHAATPRPARARHPRLRVSSCATAACLAQPPRSRYRLDAQATGGIDPKQAALATDGSACSVVGARVCTRKPRTIFTTDFTD